MVPGGGDLDWSARPRQRTRRGALGSISRSRFRMSGLVTCQEADASAENLETVHMRADSKNANHRCEWLCLQTGEGQSGVRMPFK